MQRADSKQHKLIYGLDIGTRSIVGTVGYMEKDHFVVVAQKVREHETRAMLDGQIHDIGAVGEVIRDVTDELEKELDITLSQVCIAAAGRVLQTVTTSVEIDLEGEKLITKEDIFALDSYGIEKAYEEFQKENELLQELPEVFCQETFPSGINAYLLYPFNFTTMLPVGGTRHRLLR